jgi:hypothetical protein
MASPKPSSTAPNTRLQGEPPTARTHHPNTTKPAPHLIPHVHISSHRGCEVEAAARRLSVAASTKIKETLLFAVARFAHPCAATGRRMFKVGAGPARSISLLCFLWFLALPLVLSPTPVAQRCQKEMFWSVELHGVRQEPQEPLHHLWSQYVVGHSHTCP